MNIGFIGAGRVGCSLGKYFILHGFFVTGYYSHSCQSANKASELTQSNVFDSPQDVVQNSDVIFITVPDGAIEEVWRSIKDLDYKGKTICHCSGAMSSEIFSEPDNSGGRCSFHPLLAVSSVSQDLGEAFFTIEGNETGLETARKILNQCGNTYQEIDKTYKSRYHAAAAIASNLVVGVLDMAVSMLTECGFDEEGARKALTPLVTGNVAAVMERGAKAALTGPVKRGDIETVEKHLKLLSGNDYEIYRLLSLKLLEIAQLQNEPDYNKMKTILE